VQQTRERAQPAEDRRHQVLEIAESIRREVAKRGRAVRVVHDQEIGRDIAQAVRDAVDLTNAGRNAFMRAIEDERLATEVEHAHLLELRDMERARELEDHRARMPWLGIRPGSGEECERVDRAAAEQVCFEKLRVEAEEYGALPHSPLHSQDKSRRTGLQVVRRLQDQVYGFHLRL
jgi:hypothetical protein